MKLGITKEKICDDLIHRHDKLVLTEALQENSFN